LTTLTTATDDDARFNHRGEQGRTLHGRPNSRHGSCNGTVTLVTAGALRNKVCLHPAAIVIDLLLPTSAGEIPNHAN
jgi:hypothetical protein